MQVLNKRMLNVFTANRIICNGRNELFIKDVRSQGGNGFCPVRTRGELLLYNL